MKNVKNENFSTLKCEKRMIFRSKSKVFNFTNRVFNIVAADYSFSAAGMYKYERIHFFVKVVEKD